jgi:hypothetical protein
MRIAHAIEMWMIDTNCTPDKGIKTHYYVQQGEERTGQNFGGLLEFGQYFVLCRLMQTSLQNLNCRQN